MSTKGYKMKYRYVCTSEGSVNNGKKQKCDFEYVFDEGTYHCPLCAAPMVYVCTGKSVGDLLREGAEKERNKKS